MAVGLSETDRNREGDFSTRKERNLERKIDAILGGVIFGAVIGSWADAFFYNAFYNAMKDYPAPATPLVSKAYRIASGVTRVAAVAGLGYYITS